MQTAPPNHPEHGHCAVESVEKIVAPQALAQAQTTMLLVRGMGCPTCAVRVRNSLLKLDGVLAATVVLKSGLVRVQHDPATIRPVALAPAVSNADNNGRHQYLARILAWP